MSCIKSIQRGTEIGSGTIHFSQEINPSKSIVILNGCSWGLIDNFKSAPFPVYIKSITSTTLTLSVDIHGGVCESGMFSWQVIEFA